MLSFRRKERWLKPFEFDVSAFRRRCGFPSATCTSVSALRCSLFSSIVSLSALCVVCFLLRYPQLLSLESALRASIESTQCRPLSVRTDSPTSLPCDERGTVGDRPGELGASAPYGRRGRTSVSGDTRGECLESVVGQATTAKEAWSRGRPKVNAGVMAVWRGASH